MPHMMVSTGRALIPTGNYVDKVRDTGPIAYWPLNETSGTVAHCLVNPAQNGTYSSDVSTWPVGVGIGDGNTAPMFDGANDYVNIYSAAFAAAINTGEGTLMGWHKVSAAGVWTDGVNRRLVTLRSGAANRIFEVKPVANNRLDRYYIAGGTTETRADTPFSVTAWFQFVMTWSVAADEVRYYYNGDWQETDTVLGVWAGGLGATTTCIGAADTTPTELWDGQQQHIAVWSRALTAATIKALASVA